MVIFVDIDGTLADWRWRAKIAGQMPDYEKDKAAFQNWLDNLQSPEMVLQDPPIVQVIEIIQHLAVVPHIIIYLTGRESGLRTATQKWLDANKLPPAPLYMREISDRWKSPRIFKEKVMHEVLKNYGYSTDPVLVFDDDGSADCSEMYTKNGWVHLKVLV